jgi:TRAP-type C4-dicarboxylate transport system permease small subunit
MLHRYSRLMGALYWAWMAVAGACLVIITLIIPWGVFTRYVLNSAASWPEPMAILLMIVFSFLSAAVCYRDSLHIGVVIVPMMLPGVARTAIGWLVELAMIGTNLFMLWWGTKLVAATWHQVIADFPLLSVGITYLPIPVGGAITALFVVERLWRGNLFEQPSTQTVSHISTE